MEEQYSDVRQKFSDFLERENAIRAALTLFDWDNETLAPEAASMRTAKAYGALSSAYQELLAGDELEELLLQIKVLEGLSPEKRTLLWRVEKERKKLVSIPPEEYRRFSELTAVSVQRWSLAKKQNDFSAFAPVLEEILQMRKAFASYRAEPGQSIYDVLLSDYEEGFTTKKLDRFFEKLKEGLLPLVKEVLRKNKEQPPNCGFLFQNFDVDKQRHWNKWLAAYLGFQFSRGVLSESEHPFTTSLHKDDVRITTHYYKNNLESAIFSTIHEAGHGIFEQGNDDWVTQTLLGSGTCGVHESQSRFYENILGRSRAFWKPIYGKLQKLFPDQLEKIPLDMFVRAINRSEAGVIRTEADELTYCLHIIVRYELEKKLLSGELTVSDLEEAWNRLYEEYLGVAPNTSAEGVLQDIHWAMGEFGYFPSYALGNAMAAQIYVQMSREMDVEALLEQGNLDAITGYLRTHIHRFGSSKGMEELLLEVTGESLNPTYYIDYLRKKYEREL
ncbi:MAG: carboxypeptidase M32 [Lachnospiraceae bacterium]|nr:carboxypeptidase M32 [Lachnospiraceae bacterium]